MLLSHEPWAVLLGAQDKQHVSCSLETWDMAVGQPDQLPSRPVQSSPYLDAPLNQTQSLTLPANPQDIARTIERKEELLADVLRRGPSHFSL